MSDHPVNQEFNDILTIIPVRKGSKRLLNKNKLLINGLPLWYNTVLTAQKSGLKNIIISTDDEEILDHKNIKLINIRLLYRRKCLSSDEAKTEDVIYDVLESTSHEDINTICLLQATSPLLSDTKLKYALHQFKDTHNNLKCLVAVNKLMKPCGAFYIFDKMEFLIKRTIWIEGLNICVLDEKESVDIDNIWDLRIAQAISRGRLL